MEGGLDGNIRGWSRQDPGPQGYFKFVPHLDAQGNEDGHYLLTSARWEDKWYVYVESGVSGNLSSWSGDPGPQGWFKVNPWNMDPAGTKNIPKTLGLLGIHDSPSKASSKQQQVPYSGANSLHMFEEVRLEVTHAEGTNLHSLNPSQRVLVFPVDKHSAFSQKVGRQFQQAFFEQIVPHHFSMLSRSIFEIDLEANTGATVLRNLSRNTVCVGDRRLDAGDSMRVNDGCLIGLGSQGDPPFLILRLALRTSMTGVMETCNGQSSPALMETMGRLPQAARDLFATAPRFHQTDSFVSDKRPPTMPCYSPMSSMIGGMDGAALECNYTSGAVDLSSIDAVIPLVANEVVTIGRLHQQGFFEKLLPDHEGLGCISRSHFTARLHDGGRRVEIENISRNTICVDGRPLSQGEKAELTKGSSLTFTTMGTTSLAFKLRPASSYASMPRYGYGA
jgi:hypothetical protein